MSDSIDRLSKPHVIETIEQSLGLAFVNIAAGHYIVGADKAQAELVLKSKGSESFDYVPKTEVDVPSFFISTDVVRLSHWASVQTSHFAEALNLAIAQEEIDLHRYNLVSDIRYGHDYGFIKFTKDREEADPALTLPFAKSLQFAQILEATLPNWMQWEVATRGTESYLFPWGNEFDLAKIILSYLPYHYTWEDPESDMGFRDTEFICGTKCRIDDFGEYSSAVSPFGLKGLARWGMEWNIIDQPLQTQRSKNYTTHLLRSICDLGASRTIAYLSEDEGENSQLRASNHRSFSGVPLPLFVSPQWGGKVAAFRLAYILPASNDLGSQSSERITLKSESPDWELYEFLGETREELIDYLGEPEVSENHDFSTGAVWSSVDRLYYYTRGICVKTEACYSRISRPSAQERASRVKEIILYSDTTAELTTRHEFLPYGQLVFEGVRMGEHREAVERAFDPTEPRLTGIQVSFEFDSQSQLSRVVLTLDADATVPKPPRQEKHPVLDSNPYKAFGCLRTLKGHFESVKAIAIRPDGQTFASGSSDGTVKVWDIKSGQEIWTLGWRAGYLSPVSSVAFSPDGQYIVSGSWDNTVKIWELSTGEQIRTFTGHSRSVHLVAISPDGQYVVSSSEDKTIKVWDFSTGQLLHTIDRPDIWSTLSFTITPDGRHIVAAGGEFQTLNVWNIQTGEMIRTIKGAPSSLTAIAVSPDGEKIVCRGSYDRTIAILHFSIGETLFSLEVRSSFALGNHSCLAISPDSQTLVSEGDYQEVGVWDLRTGRQISTLTGHSSFVNAIAISPDNQTVVAGLGDSTIHLWNLQTAQETHCLGGHGELVYSVVISADNQFVVSGSGDKSIKLWDLQTGREIGSLKGHSSSVHSVVISPDGQYIISGSWDKTIKVWDVQTRQEVRTLTGHSNWVNAVAISKDGKMAVSGSKDTTIKVWNLSTGEEICTIADPASEEIEIITISPDGQMVASEIKGSLKVWEIGTRKEIASCKVSSSRITSLVFSPNGEVIICGNYDGTITAYDWRSRKKVFTLKRHFAKVQSVAISTDGRTIVSGSNDNSVNVWDVEMGKLITTLEGHSNQVLSVAISQDGQYIASGGSDKSVKVWGAQRSGI